MGHACYAPGGASLPAEPSPDMEIGKVLQAAASGEASWQLECHGPGYDDSDPLWDELATALRDEGEDVGDGDLPNRSRQRLARAGQYRMVDSDMADEWVCVPGAALLARLEEVRERTAQLRREWLQYDLADARELWDAAVALSAAARAASEEEQRQLEGGNAPEAEDAAALRHPQPPPRDAPDPAGAALAAERAAGGALEALFAATATAAAGRQGLLEGLGDELERARAAVESLQKLRSLEKHTPKVKKGVAVVALALGADKAAGGASAESLAEVAKDLERCLFLGRAAAADATGGADGDLPGSPPGAGDAADAGVGGRGFDDVAGKAVASGAMDEAADRSRSPRRHGPGQGKAGGAREGGPAASMLQLARAAARTEDFLLVHHTVVWRGEDADIPRIDLVWDDPSSSSGAAGA